MAQILQYRYYGDSEKNYPSDDKYFNNLINGTIFGSDLNITQLGIQTFPGVKFYLNNAITPIIIGSTGIYELDLDGITTITKLAFDKESVNMIKNNSNAYLIVDMINGGN